MDPKKVTWTVKRIGPRNQRQYRALVHFCEKDGRSSAYEYLMNNYRQAVSKAAEVARAVRQSQAAQ